MSRNFGFRTTAADILVGLDLTGKTAVVTGGNAGLGFETCRELARAGTRIFLCCRSQKLGEIDVQNIRAEAPTADVILHFSDLSDLHQVQQSADALLSECPHIDMVICNAGIMALPDLQRTPQGFEMQSGVN
ncbi:hypothetical protein CEUSTIGMA_g8432.t1 [Chlamydomonas eustigma]|uniref:Ketoreductase (KR) domain-containing protein n=1 Tax=Chlamydomonas eustigma TaxID=1157962 RepID=A0A250XD33_9CHLO|nr:hypothetical protein CEUSTIGMA_g8432.t1 [Chlamydomonas eustigma]|eukprot:GAX80997.1 hypothetical protein CEUSTIGMA_g8432.t1 [Chlamydomonas eustigma]